VTAERHDARGYWLAEAGPAPPPRLLDEDGRADVVIVGGGYTGLWTAWHIKRLEPEARVVLLEAGACGAGPSGRNGGFVNGLWFSLPTMQALFGDQRAVDMVHAGDASVQAIGEWCEQQEVDAWFRHNGYLQASTAPHFDHAWDPVAVSCEELGERGRIEVLDRDAMRARCASPIFLDSACYRTGDTIKPARLAA
jgi:glycine/D-amino acid oxidase-like deaminating enzyme